MTSPLLNRLTLCVGSAGFAIAAALTFAHTSNVPLPCGGGSGCEQVAHDPSSQFLGVPISGFGMLAYAFVVALAFLRSSGIGHSKYRFNLLLGTFVSGAGLLTSIGLLAYSMLHIHATCAWCIASGTMMLASTLLHTLLLRAPVEESPSIKAVSTMGWCTPPVLVVAAIAIVGPHTRHDIGLGSVRLDLASYDDIAQNAHLLGSESAPITIAEFGDLMCPACREMHQRVLRFREKFPSKVSILFNHFPLTKEAGHELSKPAAIMSERLDKLHFWTFIGQVYESETKPSEADLKAIFKSNSVGNLRTEEQARASVKAEMDLGEQYGVKQTPTYILFINHKAIAVATSTNLAQELSRPEFKAVIQGPAKPSLTP